MHVCVYMCVCATHIDTYKRQKKVSDPLELELEETVSLLTGAWKSLTSELSLKPLSHIFLHSCIS